MTPLDRLRTAHAAALADYMAAVEIDYYGRLWCKPPNAILPAAVTVRRRGAVMLALYEQLWNAESEDAG